MTEIQTSEIEINAPDGGSFMAYMAEPKQGPAPVIIMIQEIFGVNAEMREKCEHLASLGYIALCPDLFWRIEPGLQLVDSVEEELQQAFDLFGKFDVNLGLKDLQSTLDHARGLEKTNGKVGCVGYCLGGKLAYMMAANTNVDASISYYGVAIETMLGDAPQITNPLMLHIAEKDEFVPPEAQNQIKSALSPLDHVSIYSYEDMDHAFARGGGMHYNAAMADLANGRTEEFLKQHLKKG